MTVEARLRLIVHTHALTAGAAWSVLLTLWGQSSRVALAGWVAFYVAALYRAAYIRHRIQSRSTLRE